MTASEKMVDSYHEMMGVICGLCRRLNPQHRDCTSCGDMEIYREALSHYQSEKGVLWVIEIDPLRWKCPHCGTIHEEAFPSEKDIQGQTVCCTKCGKTLLVTEPILKDDWVAVRRDRLDMALSGDCPLRNTPELMMDSCNKHARNCAVCVLAYLTETEGSGGSNEG